MALGDYTDFVVRPEYFETGFIETLGQNINAFNAASRGAIRLVTQEEQGHYAQTRFFDLPTSIVSRRDITSSSATTDTALTQDEVISVKLNRKVGPFGQTLDSWRKIGKDAEEMSFMLGQKVGEQVLQDYLQAALNAVEGFLSGQSGLTYDYTGTGTLVHAALISGLAKFGDAGDRIKCWVQHSKPFYDLMAANVTVASGNIGGMTLIDAQVASLNRPIVVTDSSFLYVTGTPTQYVTLGLVENAVVITETERPMIFTERVMGVENIFYRYQGEHAFNVEVKGAKWDTGNGGINPTDAALGTSSNWDAVVARDKDKAGIWIYTD